MKDLAGIARPWLFRGIRVLEMVGLITLLFGLASSRWLVAVAGGILILVSHWIYRRYFPVVSTPDTGSMGMSDGGD